MHVMVEYNDLSRYKSPCLISGLKALSARGGKGGGGVSGEGEGRDGTTRPRDDLHVMGS